MSDNVEKAEGIWGWLTVFAFSINYFLIFGFCRIFPVFVKTFQSYFNISLTAVNAIPGEDYAEKNYFR